MTDMVIPIVIGPLGRVLKGFKKGLKELDIVTVQTTALLRTTRKLRSVLETRSDWLSLRLQRKTIS